MDICYEYMVKKQKDAFDWLKIGILTVLAIWLTALAVFLYFALPGEFGGVVMVAVIGVWWGYVWLIKAFNEEYEYIITNGELDIDVIKGRSRRKHITTISLKNAEYIGNEASEKTAEAMRLAGNPEKQYRFTSGTKEDTVIVTDVISRKDNSRIRVYFSADEKLREYIRMANPKAYKD